MPETEAKVPERIWAWRTSTATEWDLRRWSPLGECDVEPARKAHLGAPWEFHPVEYVTAASRAEAVREITRLRAAGEAALYQLVILNGNWASEQPHVTNWWRIDTSEAIAELKAVLPVPAKDETP